MHLLADHQARASRSIALDGLGCHVPPLLVAVAAGDLDRSIDTRRVRIGVMAREERNTVQLPNAASVCSCLASWLGLTDYLPDHADNI